jgi:Spy/CpxP family protein refolding chaperone
MFNTLPSKGKDMRPWIKRAVFGLFGATVLLGGLTACGHQRFGGPGWQMSAEDSAKFRAKMVERVSDKLDLNTDQKALLAVLGEKLHAQRVAMMGQQPDPRAAVQALVSGDKFDRAGAQNLISEKTAAVNAGSPEVVAAAADFYDSLNREQQQKVREFMQRRGGWRRS